MDLSSHRQRHSRFKTSIAVVLLGLIALSCVATSYWYFTGVKTPLVPYFPLYPQADISTRTVSQEEIDKHTVPAENPRYLSIGRLGIAQTRVINVGVAANGDIDVPKNVHDVAWFNRSARPGTGFGTVIINAHNQGYTEAGVFARLGELKKDDTIVIERGDAARFTYSVKEIKKYNLDELRSLGIEEAMKPIDPKQEGLALITCDGNFVPRTGQFDKRIVVRAIKLN